MVFEDSQLFGYTFSRYEFPWMDHKNEPDLSTLSADLGKALGRSRVENLVAWEEPDGEHLLRPSGEVTGSRKNERSDMILMD